MERAAYAANRARRGIHGVLARRSRWQLVSGAVAQAVMAHLVGKGADVDRLLEIAVETRCQEPVAAPGHGRGAEGDDRYPSSFRATAKLACDVRSIHVGKPQVEED